MCVFLYAAICRVSMQQYSCAHRRTSGKKLCAQVVESLVVVVPELPVSYPDTVLVKSFLQEKLECDTWLCF